MGGPLRRARQDVRTPDPRRFDTFSLPPGAVIDKVVLELRQTDAKDAGYYVVWPYEITGNWSEGAVSWDSRPPFSSAGDSGVGLDTSNGYKQWDVTAIVSKWLGPTKFYGILLAGDGKTLGVRVFGSPRGRSAAAARRRLSRAGHRHANTVAHSYCEQDASNTTHPDSHADADRNASPGAGLHRPRRRARQQQLGRAGDERVSRRPRRVSDGVRRRRQRPRARSTATSRCDTGWVRTSARSGRPTPGTTRTRSITSSQRPGRPTRTGATTASSCPRAGPTARPCSSRST